MSTVSLPTEPMPSLHIDWLNVLVWVPLAVFFVAFWTFAIIGMGTVAGWIV